MGYRPDIAKMRLKQLIPLDQNECALLKYINQDKREEYFDAISEGWAVFRILFCDREEYDGNISTYDVGFYEVPPDSFDSGFADPDDVKIVPNYKCENCGNRMIPSLIENDWINYRCPVCWHNMTFDSDKTTRLRGV